MVSEDTLVLDMSATLAWELDGHFCKEVVETWLLQEVANRLGRPVRIISSEGKVVETMEPTKRERPMWEEISELAKKKPVKVSKPEKGAGYYSVTFEREDDLEQDKRPNGRTISGVQAVQNPRPVKEVG